MDHASGSTALSMHNAPNVQVEKERVGSEDLCLRVEGAIISMKAQGMGKPLLSPPHPSVLWSNSRTGLGRAWVACWEASVLF